MQRSRFSEPVGIQRCASVASLDRSGFADKSRLRCVHSRRARLRFARPLSAPVPGVDRGAVRGSTGPPSTTDHDPSTSRGWPPGAGVLGSVRVRASTGASKSRRSHVRSARGHAARRAPPLDQQRREPDSMRIESDLRIRSRGACRERHPRAISRPVLPPFPGGLVPGRGAGPWKLDGEAPAPRRRHESRLPRATGQQDPEPNVHPREWRVT